MIEYHLLQDLWVAAQWQHWTNATDFQVVLGLETWLKYEVSVHLITQRFTNLYSQLFFYFSKFTFSQNLDTWVIFAYCKTVCFQKMGDIHSIQVCQWFCSYIYGQRCTWFLYDSSTRECNMFKGQLDDFMSNCNEHSYAAYPSISECPSAFNPSSENGCYVRMI